MAQREVLSSARKHLVDDSKLVRDMNMQCGLVLSAFESQLVGDGGKDAIETSRFLELSQSPLDLLTPEDVQTVLCAVVGPVGDVFWGLDASPFCARFPLQALSF